MTRRHVLEQEPWEVVRLLALADEAETYRVETVLEHQSFGCKEREALHPAREPPEMLEPRDVLAADYWLQFSS
jgi:hypothetical protein